jgi:hypothetical protein
LFALQEVNVAAVWRVPVKESGGHGATRPVNLPP